LEIRPNINFGFHQVFVGKTNSNTSLGPKKKNPRNLIKSFSSKVLPGKNPKLRDPT